MYFSRKAVSSGAFLLAALSAMTLLSGCREPMTVLAPASPTAARIADLSWTLFWVAVAVFVVVEALLIYAIFRFRARGEEAAEEEPRQIYGHTKLEIVWTAVPAIVLVGVTILMVGTMTAVAQPPPDSIQVHVVGHQWWWEVSYPYEGVTTANEIHVPVGRPVRVTVAAADVVHSLWVPELGGKIDLIPGTVNETWFQADKAGVFEGHCTEFCGVQHAMMGFLVVSEPAEEYEAWLQRQKAPAVTPTKGIAKQGMEQFLNSPCIGCHAVKGTRAQGVMGPDLTHVGSRRTLAANSLPNTPENMRGWLANPDQVKEGSKMPNLHLSPEVVEQMATYLESLK